MNFELCLDLTWSAEVFPSEYRRHLTYYGLNKLLSISPRPYRHQYERLIIEPIQHRLRLTRERKERIRKFQHAIVKFVNANFLALNKIRP